MISAKVFFIAWILIPKFSADLPVKPPKIYNLVTENPNVAWLHVGKGHRVWKIECKASGRFNKPRCSTVELVDKSKSRSKADSDTILRMKATLLKVKMMSRGKVKK